MKKFKGGYSCFTEAVCPICGKSFFPTPEWVYNTGKYSHGKRVRVCSYKCYMEAQRNPPKKMTPKQEERQRMDELARELLAKKQSGMSVREIAEEYGLTPTGVGMRIAKCRRDG